MNLRDFLKESDKKYGKGTAILMSDPSTLEMQLLKTGIVSLDMACGGGIPKGRMIEIYGPPAAGKTTLALHIISRVIKEGGCALYVDLEQALNVSYLHALDIDPDKLAISQPDDGNTALSIVQMASEEEIDVIVVDSVAALQTQQELEGDYGDANMGTLARLMSQACRKLVNIVSKNKTILIWINQTRDKIGGYGTGMITTGGNALRFYTTQRFELSYVAQLKEGDNVYGNRARIKIVKNKIHPPYKSAELDLIYGKGFCPYGDVIDLATEKGIITKAGSWYSWGDTKLGQGRETVREILKNDDSIFDSIKKSLCTG